MAIDVTFNILKIVIIRDGSPTSRVKTEIINKYCWYSEINYLSNYQLYEL